MFPSRFWLRKSIAYTQNCRSKPITAYLTQANNVVASFLVRRRNLCNNYIHYGISFNTITHILRNELYFTKSQISIANYDKYRFLKQVYVALMNGSHLPVSHESFPTFAWYSLENGFHTYIFCTVNSHLLLTIEVTTQYLKFCSSLWYVRMTHCLYTLPKISYHRSHGLNLHKQRYSWRPSIRLN